MGKRDDLRKAVKQCYDAVIAGEHYTITRKGEPVAVAIPYADYQEMNRQLSRLGQIETDNERLADVAGVAADLHHHNLHESEASDE